MLSFHSLLFHSIQLAAYLARRLRVAYVVVMNGRRDLRYDFLQVTDEMLDVRAPALARLLSAGGRKVSRADAVVMVLDLERYVVRRVNDEADDIGMEFHACAWLPDDRASAMVSAACNWPLAKSTLLLKALADPEVRVLDWYSDGMVAGWRVRGIPERYGRFANQKRASRERTRNNDRARAAGWEPGEGRTWVGPRGMVLPSLKDVIACLEQP